MVTLITFLALTILVAIISSYLTRKDNLGTQDGYFLAGRGLSGLVIAGSLEMTNLSTEQLVGQSGQSYATNMSAMHWSITSCVGLIALALIFLPRYLKLGITTIPEYLEKRFDSTTKRIISILFLLGYLLTYLPTVLYSGSLAFNQIFHIDERLHITQFHAIALLCIVLGVVGSIYAIFGGLKAVAVSDTLNGVLLLSGGILVPILAICILGNGNFFAGIHDFLANVPAEKFNSIAPANSLPPMIPWPLLFTGLIFNCMFYWGTNQSIVQRSLAAKNLKEAQKGALFAAVLKLLDPFFITICGLLAYRFFGNSLSNADLAYPQLLIAVVPNWLLGLIAAALFGAILSSFNSALNSCATLYTLDFHRPLFNKTCSDAHLVKIGKRFGVILAIISIGVAPFVINAPSGLYDFLQDCFGFYAESILAIVLIGFFTKKVPPIAPKITLVAHAVIYGIMHFIPYNCHYLYIRGALFIFDICLMLIIGKLYPMETAFELQDVGAVDLKEWRLAKPLAIFVVCAMLGMYVLFSPLGLAA